MTRDKCFSDHPMRASPIWKMEPIFVNQVASADSIGDLICLPQADSNRLANGDVCKMLPADMKLNHPQISEHIFLENVAQLSQQTLWLGTSANFRSSLIDYCPVVFEQIGEESHYQTEFQVVRLGQQSLNLIQNKCPYLGNLTLKIRNKQMLDEVNNLRADESSANIPGSLQVTSQKKCFQVKLSFDKMDSKRTHVILAIIGCVACNKSVIPTSERDFVGRPDKLISPTGENTNKRSVWYISGTGEEKHKKVRPLQLASISHRLIIVFNVAVPMVESEWKYSEVISVGSARRARSVRYGQQEEISSTPKMSLLLYGELIQPLYMMYMKTEGYRLKKIYLDVHPSLAVTNERFVVWPIKEYLHNQPSDSITLLPINSSQCHVSCCSNLRSRTFNRHTRKNRYREHSRAVDNAHFAHNRFNRYLCQKKSKMLNARMIQFRPSLRWRYLIKRQLIHVSRHFDNSVSKPYCSLNFNCNAGISAESGSDGTRTEMRQPSTTSVQSSDQYFSINTDTADGKVHDSDMEACPSLSSIDDVADQGIYTNTDDEYISINDQPRECAGDIAEKKHAASLTFDGGGRQKRHKHNGDDVRGNDKSDARGKKYVSTSQTVVAQDDACQNKPKKKTRTTETLYIKFESSIKKKVTTTTVLKDGKKPPGNIKPRLQSQIAPLDKELNSSTPEKVDNRGMVENPRLTKIVRSNEVHHEISPNNSQKSVLEYSTTEDVYPTKSSHSPSERLSLSESISQSRRQSSTTAPKQESNSCVNKKQYSLQERLNCQRSPHKSHSPPCSYNSRLEILDSDYASEKESSVATIVDVQKLSNTHRIHPIAHSCQHQNQQQPTRSDTTDRTDKPKQDINKKENNLKDKKHQNKVVTPVKKDTQNNLSEKRIEHQVRTDSMPATRIPTPKRVEHQGRTDSMPTTRIPSPKRVEHQGRTDSIPTTRIPSPKNELCSKLDGVHHKKSFVRHKWNSPTKRFSAESVKSEVKKEFFSKSKSRSSIDEQIGNKYENEPSKGNKYENELSKGNKYENEPSKGNIHKKRCPAHTKTLSRSPDIKRKGISAKRATDSKCSMSADSLKTDKMKKQKNVDKELDKQKKKKKKQLQKLPQKQQQKQQKIQQQKQQQKQQQNQQQKQHQKQKMSEKSDAETGGDKCQPIKKAVRMLRSRSQESNKTTQTVESSASAPQFVQVTMMGEPGQKFTYCRSHNTPAATIKPNIDFGIPNLNEENILENVQRDGAIHNVNGERSLEINEFKINDHVTSSADNISIYKLSDQVMRTTESVPAFTGTVYTTLTKVVQLTSCPKIRKSVKELQQAEVGWNKSLLPIEGKVTPEKSKPTSSKKDKARYFLIKSRLRSNSTDNGAFKGKHSTVSRRSHADSESTVRDGNETDDAVQQDKMKMAPSKSVQFSVSTEDNKAVEDDGSNKMITSQEHIDNSSGQTSLAIKPNTQMNKLTTRPHGDLPAIGKTPAIQKKEDSRSEMTPPRKKRPIWLKKTKDKLRTTLKPTHAAKSASVLITRNQLQAAQSLLKPPSRINVHVLYPIKQKLESPMVNYMSLHDSRAVAYNSWINSTLLVTPMNKATRRLVAKTGSPVDIKEIIEGSSVDADDYYRAIKSMQELASRAAKSVTYMNAHRSATVDVHGNKRLKLLQESQSFRHKRVKDSQDNMAIRSLSSVDSADVSPASSMDIDIALGLKSKNGNSRLHVNSQLGTDKKQIRKSIINRSVNWPVRAAKDVRSVPDLTQVQYYADMSEFNAINMGLTWMVQSVFNKLPFLHQREPVDAASGDTHANL